MTESALPNSPAHQMRGWLPRLGHGLPRREIFGWQLSRSGKATTASAALEQALISRFGTLGQVREPYPAVFGQQPGIYSRNSTRLARSYGLRQAFITPHCP